jgi:hypothetical protein
MNASELLIDLYGRIPPLAAEACEGASADDLTATVVPGTNPVGWLVWHVARVQDMQFSELAGSDQLWTTGDWAGRFGLDPDPGNMGYGHSPTDVAAVQPVSAEAALAYLDAVAERTRDVLAGYGDEDLDEVIDRNWDPPVTLGVRLVSVADDGLQHVGQAAYLRGLLKG